MLQLSAEYTIKTLIVNDKPFHSFIGAVSISEVDCNRLPTFSVLGHSAASQHSVISPLFDVFFPFPSLTSFSLKTSLKQRFLQYYLQFALTAVFFFVQGKFVSEAESI